MSVRQRSTLFLAGNACLPCLYSIVLKSSKSKPVSHFVDGRDELGVGSSCVWHLVLLVLVVLHVVDHEPRKVIDTDDGQSHFFRRS